MNIHYLKDTFPTSPCFQSKDQKTFPVKDQIVNVLEFVGHTITFANTQSCCVVQKQPETVDKLMGITIFQENFIYKNRWQAYRLHFANLCFKAGLSTQKEGKRGSKHHQIYAAKSKHQKKKKCRILFIGDTCIWSLVLPWPLITTVTSLVVQFLRPLYMSRSHIKEKLLKSRTLST